MRLALVTCSIHHERTDRSVAALAAAVTQARPTWQIDVVEVDAFADPFRGTYIRVENADSAQRNILHTLIKAEAIVFVVPSYYKSPPGAAKNFFDVVDCPQLYADTALAFVSSNHKNQDFGARELQRVVQAILELKDITAMVVTEIPIVHPDRPDQDPDALARVVTLVERYAPAASQD